MHALIHRVRNAVASRRRNCHRPRAATGFHDLYRYLHLR